MLGDEKSALELDRALGLVALGALALWGLITAAYGVMGLVDSVSVWRMLSSKTGGSSWLSLEASSAAFLGWLTSFNLLLTAAALGTVRNAVFRRSLWRSFAYLALLGLTAGGVFTFSQVQNDSEDLPLRLMTWPVLSWLVYPFAAAVILIAAWLLLRPTKPNAQASMASASTS